MAATYLDVTLFPLTAVAGFAHALRVTARNADGSVDAGFTGTVSFASTDAAATLPAPATYALADAGTRLFRARLRTRGTQSLTASAAGLTPATARTTVLVRPPGWGFDDFGVLPLGGAAPGVGVYLRAALATGTRVVEAEVSNLVQDSSPYLPGDALNPASWTVRRLDTLAYLEVVSVAQVGVYRYALTLLEQLGAADVVHRASAAALVDAGGNPLASPREADFLGLLDAGAATAADALAAQRAASRDLANPQVPAPSGSPAGTLQVTAAGDYALVTGAALVEKLLLRRLTSAPGDFFHLPAYGLGLRVKEPVPAASLPRLKASIEQQALREPEVESASATLTQDPARGLLTVEVRARLRKTGETARVGFAVGA